MIAMPERFPGTNAATTTWLTMPDSLSAPNFKRTCPHSHQSPKDHNQICIRHLDCIKGYFRPMTSESDSRTSVPQLPWERRPWERRLAAGPADSMSAVSEPAIDAGPPADSSDCKSDAPGPAASRRSQGRVLSDDGRNDDQDQVADHLRGQNRRLYSERRVWIKTCPAPARELGASTTSVAPVHVLENLFITIRQSPFNSGRHNPGSSFATLPAKNRSLHNFNPACSGAEGKAPHPGRPPASRSRECARLRPTPTRPDPASRPAPATDRTDRGRRRDAEDSVSRLGRRTSRNRINPDP